MSRFANLPTLRSCPKDLDEPHNTTPHSIRVYAEDKKTLIKEYPREEKWQLRVESTPQQVVGRFQGIPLVSMQESRGFTEDEWDIIRQAHRQKDALIVSRFTAQAIRKFVPAFSGRIFIPDTGPDSVVRDIKGNIQGVSRFEVG